MGRSTSDPHQLGAEAYLYPPVRQRGTPVSMREG
jgi:hypothetical protein